MSVRSLTKLNAQLIRSAITPQVEADDTAETDALTDWMTGEGATTITLVTGEGEESGPTSWSTAQPFEYRQTIDWIRTNVFGGDLPEGMSPFITQFARGWGEKVFTESGGFEEGGHWPTLNELLKDEEFQNGVTWLPFVQARLPAAFTTDSADGGTVMATSDPLTGVQFVTIPDPTPLQEAITSGDTSRPVGRGAGGEIDMDAPPESTQTEVELDPADRAKFGGAATATTGQPPQTVQDLIRENPELKTPRSSGVTHIPEEELTQRLSQASGRGGGGGRRGGGGGGGGRRELVFDRASLVEQVDRLYEGWLIADAPDAQVDRIVDGYIREAKGFWSKEGGQLEFDTFVRNQIKALPRYRMIYRDKPEAMTEEEFRDKYARPIAGLGLRPETTESQTVAAMTSGGSPTEQLRRVGRTREAQGSRAFSQELAQTLAGLGPAMRFG